MVRYVRNSILKILLNKEKTMVSPVIFSRTPFRLPLGGGSTDLPSYYENYGGFVFTVAVNMYMDIFIKKPRSDDLIHVNYKKFESVPSVDEIKHDIVKEALKIIDITDSVAISFKSDTPAGTGMGSSGACSVGLLKGLSLYKGRELSNLEVAEKSFILTQNLMLPDGKQDPYACALGGFVVLSIDSNGLVKVEEPNISKQTTDIFFNNTLFFYTGVVRESKTLLAVQNKQEVIDVKHCIKEIGHEIYKCFLAGDLDSFGKLMDKHWNIKRQMLQGMTNDQFDEIYLTARNAGALGGKIMGAGGGGYFMFYCPSNKVKKLVRLALEKFKMREMNFTIDKIGTRAESIDI